MTLSNMLNRNNPGYMLDELYLPMLLSNLYQGLVMFVLTKRLENMLTNKTDIFHINNHLSSYKSIYGLLDVFDKHTNIYLYGNIRRLKINLGKNKVLNEILEKVYNRNIYGVGKIEFYKNKPTLVNDNINNHEVEYYNNKYSFKIDKANNTFYNLLNKELDTKEVITLEDGSGYVYNNMLLNDYNIDTKYSNLFIKTLVNKADTKTFVLDSPERISTHYNNAFIMALSNLLYNLSDTSVDFYITYYNPIDLKVYKLSGLDIKNILLANIIKMYDIDTDFINIELSGIYIPQEKDVVLASTWYKDKNSNIYDFIIKDINNSFFNHNDLTDYFNRLYTIEKNIWYLMSNSIDLTIKNDIRIISNHILQNKYINTNVSSIEDYITLNNLSSFTRNNPIDNIVTILDNLISLPIRPFKNIMDRFHKLISFFDKVTSYTIKLTYDSEYKSVFVNNITKANLNLGYKSYIEIKDAIWHKYDEVDYYILNMKIQQDNIKVNKNIDYIKYNIKPIRDFSILTIYDSIMNKGIITGGMYTRMRNYIPGEPYATKYDNDSIDIFNNNINTPIINKKPYIQTHTTLDNDFYNYENNLIAIASLHSYFKYYSTRNINYTSILVRDDIKVKNEILDIEPMTILDKSSYVNTEHIDVTYPSYYLRSLSREYTIPNVTYANIPIDNNLIYGSTKTYLISNTKDYIATHNILDESITNNNIIATSDKYSYFKYYSTRNTSYSTVNVNEDVHSTSKDISIEPMTILDKSVYSNIDNINKAYPSYYLHSLSRPYATSNLTKENIKLSDGDVYLDLSAIPYNKTYRNDTVNDELDDIYADITYSVKSK